MKSLFLKPHNEIAVREIRKDLKTSNMVCTVRATGTGKSYIIAELVRDYNSCLIMAPNYFIMDQQAEVIKQRGLKKNNKVQFVGYNYAAVSDNFVIPTGLDLIVLDEFHRAGAPVWWNNGIRRIIEANPEAKVLGTTATNIRGTDKRDMAEELFNGKVTMPMTLPMAWSQRVLPLPKYVAALYNVEEVLEEEKTKILESKITEEEKKHALKELKCFYVNWQKSGGIPGMLKRFFPTDTKKMIVFVDRAEEAEKMKKTVGGWFKAIGIKPIIKTIHYKKIDSNKILKQFKKKDNRLRIVIAVNKLNEGVHVPGVDCVMFLRRTHSNIVFLQQMGRCLSVNDGEKMPVIFDLVGNIELTQDVDGIFALKKELDEMEEKRITSGKDNRKKLVFQIEGYLLEQVRMIQLIRNLYNITERFLAICRNIISRKAWDEARWINNRKLYKWIRDNKDKYPEAMTIWKHISSNRKDTDYYLSLCRDIIEREAWDEARWINNKNLYNWIQVNKDKYSEAKVVWEHIFFNIKDADYYLSLCRDIIKRKAWDEASNKNNINLHAWLRNNEDKYPEAAEVWKHVSKSEYYLSLCRDIISRKAWDEAKQENNIALYRWIKDNKDKYPEAAEILEHIYIPKRNEDYYLFLCRDIISRKAWSEVRAKNNFKIYQWIRYNKGKYPEAAEIWEHIKR